MKKIEFENLPLWKFENISKFKEVNHYVSGRKGGSSKGELGELNLSYKVGDLPENVEFNRSRLAQVMQVERNHLLFPVQTHSVNVGIVISKDDTFEDTDALVSNLPGICISVMSADCVPLLFFDPNKRVIGAAHAGWRGTVGKIGQKTIQAMVENFSSDPNDIVVAIGPSISQEIYQVGPEVIQAFKAAFKSKLGLVSMEDDLGKGYLNLWEANKRQLLEVGVKEENIEVAGLCTFKNCEDFFSARKSNNKAGRFAAGIMLV